MIKVSNMTQWDLNRTVEIDSPAQVHFALIGSDECLTVESDGTTANVPNVLLQNGGDILCWIYKDNQTIDKARISVSRKPKPTDYIFTETEVLSFGKLNDRIDDLAEKIENIEVGSFTLPVASSSTLGGIKVGRNLTISDDGTLDAPFAVKGDKGDKGEPGIQGVKGDKGDKGEPGTPGKNGADGKTPVRGTDYWTEEDIQTIHSYVNEQLGVIENGTY